jgi:hypothetical protein
MDFKVGDRVRLSDGQEGTVTRVEGDRVFLDISIALGSYIRVATVGEIETPLDPTQPPPGDPVD